MALPVLMSTIGCSRVHGRYAYRKFEAVALRLLPWRPKSFAKR